MIIARRSPGAMVKSPTVASSSPRGGRERPAPMLARAQQRGEAAAGVEARERRPVDRAVLRHQRGRLRAAQQSVVFDTSHDGYRWSDPVSVTIRGGVGYGRARVK